MAPTNNKLHESAFDLRAELGVSEIATFNDWQFMQAGGFSTTTRLRANKWCLIFTVCAFGWCPTGFASTAAPQDFNAVVSEQAADIEVFVREGCPHCAKAEAFLAALQRELPQLKIVVRDVRKEPASLERLKRLTESRRLAAVSVPTFIVSGRMIVGFSEEAGTGQLIRESLAQAHTQSRETANASNICQAAESPPCEPSLPPASEPETFAVNILGHRISLDQVGLPLFTLAMGLLDGFNPCSMWVLLLMISLLTPMKNRQRMLTVAGTFVAVQGIAYYLFMAAWLNVFLLIGISRMSEIIIAAIALLAGAINLKDFWKLGWGVSLSIPAAAKPGIYARMRRILQAESLAGAIFGAITLAILVQVVEFVCTSGFPALFTRILTLQQLNSLSYYSYLLLYDLAYMLDDAIVLAVGVITLSQRRLQEKEGRYLKLISGLTMVGLGIYLLLVPH